MPIIAKEGEKREFEQVEDGTVQAVCYDVWDIGIQKVLYKGEEKLLHKVVVGFEVNQKVTQGEFVGKRMTINRFYTLSLGEKAHLRQDLESWRGKKFTPEELAGFDIETLVGANCMLSIVKNEKEKSIISGISKLMNGLTKMEPENERSIPKWIQKMKDSSVEQIPF